MSCHIFFSIPDANNNVIPFRCALPMWIQRFREMLWVCEDGLRGHWYVLGLIATNTWCKPGHCSSVAVNPSSGVKSEPTAGYLANPPFWTISIFSSPKWGPPLAKDHRLIYRAGTSWYNIQSLFELSRLTQSHSFQQAKLFASYRKCFPAVRFHLFSWIFLDVIWHIEARITNLIYFTRHILCFPWIEFMHFGYNFQELCP